GKELFTSPYQYIAADANNTESISAIDLIEIRKLILGIYTEYPSNKSWRFVEKGFQMNNEHPWPFGENIALLDLVGNVTDNDFIGVKIGDVNNSVQANVNQVLPRNGRRVLTVEMDAPANVEAGDMVQVKLTIPEMVEGFQWTLETEGLAFESINSEVMKISDNHVGILHDGVMTMSWNAEDASSTGQVMYLNFIATASGNISGMIHMTSKVTEAEAYTLSGEILDVKLGHTSLTPEFALYQNSPNPWNELTTIGFDLPADDVVKFTIFEASGKVVKAIESEFKAGYNTITLRANELPASGVMYYRLESGEYSASKKMVLIK
ncbi:MAG TPA: T9SS type A sorting domain-containing protein, partial [Saprospiraceae bacterium]